MARSWCPVCWVCASCKGRCKCWFSSSQVRTFRQVLDNGWIKDKELIAEVSWYIADRKMYARIKDTLKGKGIVFKDDYVVKQKTEKIQKSVYHPVFDGWCFKSIGEWAEKLGIVGGVCEYRGLGARERCIHCNSLKFYQNGKPCLAITSNLCEDVVQK